MELETYDEKTVYDGSIFGICDHAIYCCQDSLTFVKGTLNEIATGKKKENITNDDMSLIHQAIALACVDFLRLIIMK